MIPFNAPSFVGNESSYIGQAVENGHLSGNGPFTKASEDILVDIHGGSPALLTTSCTHALELAARLLDLGPGDEVIVPAYTFVSTASAFMWNGARPRFADIELETMNVDPQHVEHLISDKTKAICIVHYAGVSANPFVFRDMADSLSIPLIEDNAHGLGASFGGQTLGTFGAMSTLSFHETKNISCGEGGAIILNDSTLVERAEILREKGTNRSRFLRGQEDKYTWVDNGSSWVMSDLLAAVLLGQLEHLEQVQERRLALWDRYFDSLGDWSSQNGIHLPHIPKGARHSGHMFYLRLPTLTDRNRFIEHMRNSGIMTVFHYQALNTSPEGIRVAESADNCPNSKVAADTVVRLPLFTSLSSADQDRVIKAALTFNS